MCGGPARPGVVRAAAPPRAWRCSRAGAPPPACLVGPGRLVVPPPGRAAGGLGVAAVWLLRGRA